jgi:SAM-dependent methyltransferase
MSGSTEAEGAVSYQLSAEAWRDFPRLIREAALSSPGRTVCDIGGGARPALDIDFVREHALNYTVMDISADELAKAPAGYHKLQVDIGSSTLPAGVEGTFDVVFSKTLAEHVRDAEQFHRNVFRLLAEGGVAIHLFPTLFAPAFVANRLLPAPVTRWLLSKVQGQRRDSEGLEGKFPAYYSWCRGPSARQFRRFEKLGFEVAEYRCYFGTPGYYRPLRLAWLDSMVSRWLLRHSLSSLSAYAVVVLRRAQAARLR